MSDLTVVQAMLKRQAKRHADSNTGYGWPPVIFAVKQGRRNRKETIIDILGFTDIALHFDQDGCFLGFVNHQE